MCLISCFTWLETWSLILREEYQLEVFENNVYDPTQGKLIDLIYIWPHQLYANTG